MIDPGAAGATVGLLLDRAGIELSAEDRERLVALYPALRSLAECLRMTDSSVGAINSERNGPAERSDHGGS